MNGVQLEVNTFKYLGATLSKDGSCTADIRTTIAKATTAVVRLDKSYRSNTIGSTIIYRL